MRQQKPCRDQHATVNRYVSGCSCIECCDAWSAYQRENRLGSRTHHLRTTPVMVTREHIFQLLNHLSVTEIARRAAVDRWTIRQIRDGKQRRILRRTEEAILGVTPTGDDIADASRSFVCRNCGAEVTVSRVSDRRRVYCSDACQRQYWRRVSKNPTRLTEHRTWELEWSERRDAS